MESVLAARARLAKYPLLLAECAPQAAQYGKCVGDNLDDVRKHQCAKEFSVFMDCIKASAKKMKTKI
jgi:hypothetical protein